MVDVGGDASSLFGRARVHFRAGRPAEARDLLERAHAAAPADRAVRFALAACQNALGEWAAAETHLRLVLDVEPEHHLAWYQLGCSLQGQGRPDEAAAAYRRALKGAGIPDAWNRLRACEAPHQNTPASSTGHVPQAVRGTDEQQVAVVVGQVTAPPPSGGTLAQQIDQHGVAEPGHLLPGGRRHLLARHVAPPALTVTAFLVVVAALGGGPAGYGPLVIALLLLFAAGAWAAVWLQSVRYRYFFYERRMDLHLGALTQRRRAIWYYEITEVRYVQGPVDALTRTASLEIDYKPGDHVLTELLPGLGTPDEVHALYEMLQPSRVRERRTMKGIII
ncbi:PH domain-containing protein [Streptomyces naphthomycinicus]|uniref:PH domain-containing protein n=1 Tax=Streptomyces naphthomycinicus TaxID=2872625 RepID=UPI001CED7C1A|nr:tetratricopeptide repeat protein [Streptomyces sp. TML10]